MTVELVDVHFEKAGKCSLTGEDTFSERFYFL